MKTDTTYVFGTAADEYGIIRHTKTHSEELPATPVDRRRGLRVWQTVELNHEPASAYASSHPAPMPMRWAHQDEIGRIVALRRNHGRLSVVAESTLEPDELAWLTNEYGELRWSTSTNNRRNEKLRIDEISLTASPASVALPAVRWYRLHHSKGNMPTWVQEELKRADKLEFRQRRELQVHDLDYERNPNSDPERYERDLGLIPGSRAAGPHMTLPNGERVPMEYRPARVLSVGGRPVGNAT